MIGEEGFPAASGGCTISITNTSEDGTVKYLGSGNEGPKEDSAFNDWLDSIYNTDWQVCCVLDAATEDLGSGDAVLIWLRAAFQAGANSELLQNNLLRNGLDTSLGKDNWSIYRAENGEWEFRTTPNTPFDFTPYEKTPFGEWPDEAKLAAFKGVLIDKDEWQYHCFLSKDWKKSDAYKHGFNMSNRYRPKPTEEARIPWDHLPDWVRVCGERCWRPLLRF